MISARGAMTLDSVLDAVTDYHVKNAGRAQYQVRHCRQVWSAMCKLLRSRLLNGHSCSISPKTLAFTLHSKPLATDGQTRFVMRAPKYGFHPSFCTTYALDSGAIPREDATGCMGPIHRLSGEALSQEAKLPVELINLILRDVFLFVGESVFHGTLVQLTFDGVATLLLKKDRSQLSFDEQFLTDMAMIDSRKWPAAVREMALEAVASAVPSSKRPESSSSSSRPASQASAHRPTASSAGVSGSPPLHTKPLDPNDRPSFVSSAPTGRLFSEIKHEREKENHRPASGGARHQRPCSAKSGASSATTAAYGGQDEPEEESIYNYNTNTGGGVANLQLQQLQQAQQLYGAAADLMDRPPTPGSARIVKGTPVAIVQDEMVPIQGDEEESVYAVVSPARHHDTEESAPISGEQQQQQQAAPCAEAATAMPAQHGRRPNASLAATDIFFLKPQQDDDRSEQQQPPASRASGRRRFPGRAHGGGEMFAVLANNSNSRRAARNAEAQ